MTASSARLPRAAVGKAPRPVVGTACGPVRGKRSGDVDRFLGIPFAAAPVGAARFAPPRPPRPWTEPLDAGAYGPTAQRRPMYETEPTTIPEPSIPGDAVLSVNVFTPADRAPGAGLPVLVWIHGGGFVAGSPASPWYGGAAFCRAGVVVVTVGYRLGIEGFLHLSDAPDNRAVADWLAALGWVRTNIGAFGGDPDRVTIAGQSAGGGAALTLLGTPAARGLFRGAIAMSAGLLSDQSPGQAEAVSARFTARTGFDATAAALQRLTVDELDDARVALTDPGSGDGLVLGPIADGDLVPEPVLGAIRAGHATPVPLLLGFTADEFSAHVPKSADLAAVRGLLATAGLSDAAAAAFLDMHRGTSPGMLLGRALTDSTFRSTGLAVAEARRALSLATWLYEFRWPSPTPRFRGLSVHCIDVPFAFSCLGAERVEAVAGTDPPELLAEQVHGAFVRFVRDLDPGPTWPAYSGPDRATMLFDAQSSVQFDPLRSEREIWVDGHRLRSFGPAGPR